MEEPTSAITADDQPVQSSRPSNISTAPTTSVADAIAKRWGASDADQKLVAETLEWIAGQLGIDRARFIRMLPSGRWIVQSAVHGEVVAQPADRAEIAMAWSVALSRCVYSAARPRIMTTDGNGVRPIAMTTYLAMPVLCQQGIAGVIEAAGDFKPGAERAARSAGDRLSEFATRLMFDPGLWLEPRITADTECNLASSLSTPIDSPMTVQEWDFSSTLDSPKTLSDVATALNVPVPDAMDLARSMVSRGLITLRTPTGVLATASSAVRPTNIED